MAKNKEKFPAKSREQYIAENSEGNYNDDLITFSLLDASTVKRRQREGDVTSPYMKSDKYLDIPKDKRWNTKQLNSKLLQGILNGDPVDKIAKSFVDVIGNNKSATMRNARTMITGAECSGRMDSYTDLADKGVIQKKVWIATPDDRTRASHLEIDGEERDIDEEFSNKLMYPADPDGDASEVYNCRCSIRDRIVGFKRADGSIKYVTADRGETKHDVQIAEEKERREGEGEKPAETEKATDAKMNRDYDTDFAKYYGKDYYDAMCDLLDKCENDDLRTVWEQYQAKIVAKDPNFKGRAYNSGTNIHVNKNNDAKGSSWDAPYGTTFHESGHAIDHLTRDLPETDGIKFTFSSAYQDGIFPATIREEVAEMVKEKDIELKALFNAHKGDYEWLHEHGFIPDSSWYYYKNYGSFLGGEPKYSKSFAYSALQKEIMEIPAIARASLSDMLEGATDAKISCGFGHGKSYWKKIMGVDEKLATEAFAEMTSATVTNDESLKTIKQYLPKSYEIYNNMIRDIASKGGE